MNKKNSLLFQVTLFFTIIFIFINTIIVVQFLLDNHNTKMFHMKRYIKSSRVIHDAKEKGLSSIEINKKLKSFYTELSNLSLEFLNKKAKKRMTIDEPIEIFYLEGMRYIHIKPPKLGPNRSPKKLMLEREKPIVLLDYLSKEKIQYFWLIVLFLIDFLLIWFYYFLYKKLKPLVNLKNDIVKFSKGDLDINTEINGNDEIAQVSNEFNNAINKIRELNDSRKLFLRNILHELKTPITKGKLISDTLDNNRKKEILQKAFLRLEYLLGEFVKLEELSSGKMTLVKKEFRVIDLLDQALDILLIDKSKVDIYPNSTKICVDYEVFAIALKNLIDNSLKYNTNGKPEIFIKEDSLLIKNKGNPLKKNFEEYLKPFNREYESIDRGLGLGLYITNNVIESHGYKLFYLYSKDFHIFKIQFKTLKDK